MASMALEDCWETSGCFARPTTGWALDPNVRSCTRMERMQSMGCEILHADPEYGDPARGCERLAECC